MLQVHSSADNQQALDRAEKKLWKWLVGQTRTVETTRMQKKGAPMHWMCRAARCMSNTLALVRLCGCALSPSPCDYAEHCSSIPQRMVDKEGRALGTQILKEDFQDVSLISAPMLERFTIS